MACDRDLLQASILLMWIEDINHKHMPLMETSSVMIMNNLQDLQTEEDFGEVLEFSTVKG